MSSGNKDGKEVHDHHEVNNHEDDKDKISPHEDDKEQEGDEIEPMEHDKSDLLTNWSSKITCR